MTEQTPATEADEVAEIRKLHRKRVLDLLRGDKPLNGSTLTAIGKYLEAVDAVKPPPQTPAATAVNASELPFPVKAPEETPWAGLKLPFAVPAASARHQDD